ncbi:MAG: class II aldolase/adducin family protein [Patescibacteria group bacterium]
MKVKRLHLEEANRFAREIGDHSDWVQGGGGNFSIKMNNGYMLIKASGFSLKDVNQKQGLVMVGADRVKKYYQSLNKKKITVALENKSVKEIAKQTTDFLNVGNIRASIETGFHAFLQTYVLHTHSVYANVFTCSKKGEERLQNIFSSTKIRIAWVPYASPGFGLPRAIELVRIKFIRTTGLEPHVFFLENHGLIVQADTVNACLGLHKSVDRILRIALNTKAVFAKLTVPETVDRSLFEPILFPDQVVYLNGKKKVDLGSNRVMKETAIAYLFIKQQILKMGGVLNPLEKKSVVFIKKMESEKFRQRVL